MVSLAASNSDAALQSGGRDVAARRVTPGALFLVLPAGGVFVVFYGAALGFLIWESVNTFVPGRLTSSGVLTLDNYVKLFQPAFIRFFFDTFRLSFVATSISLVAAYAIAYFIARRRSGALRTFYIALLVAMLFVSGIVRVYGLALSLGTSGLLGYLRDAFAVEPNNIWLLEANVVAGIAHYAIPIMALTLVGAIQNVDPRLAEAAEALGAARWRAFLDTTVMLTMPGIVSAFLLGYAMAISAFTIPLFLGKGIVVFITMLIYQRFSEIPNYPFGSAIAVALLLLSLAIVYAGIGLLRRGIRTVDGR